MKGRGRSSFSASDLVSSVMRFTSSSSVVELVVVVVVVSVIFISEGAAEEIDTVTSASTTPNDLLILKPVADYNSLYSDTSDKEGLACIKALHQQLDDDKDGYIEPSETGDFIRGDLKYGSDARQGESRQNKFHRKDAEITVKDLWDTWRKSEAHNWTIDQTLDWLTNSVELPQYVDLFRAHGVNGSKLPQVAVSSILTKVIGIDNAIHRSKISLKAMDVVLFGAPKELSNPVKDAVLTGLLMLAITGFIYAYRQNRRSQRHLKKMMADMDSLSKAEEALREVQTKLTERDHELESLVAGADPTSGSVGGEDAPLQVEVARVMEENEFLRNELQKAEVELEDKCFMAPPILQHWLQLTYELESASYGAKKKAAESQLMQAKDMCEKLKKKRSSLVGAFVSTHGRSIDDVDRSILEAKTALLDVTKDLTERSHRWRQIEMLCGCSIVNNSGVAVLRNLVRNMGLGRTSLQRPQQPPSSKMSNRGSQDDLRLVADTNDDDRVSVASTYISLPTSRNPMSPGSVVSTESSIHRVVSSAALAPRKSANFPHHQHQKDSSKESSSDELLHNLPGKKFVWEATN